MNMWNLTGRVRVLSLFGFVALAASCENSEGPVAPPAGAPAPHFKITSGAGIWSTRAPMATARYALAAGVVNGILYAVGGQNDSGFLSTVEAHDPATNTWTPKASMGTARYALAAGAVNGALYAIGGHNGSTSLATVEAYDPATNTWAAKAQMPTARYGLAAGVVNGVLYAIGGHDGSTSVGTLEAYNPSANAWTPKTSMPTPRYGLVAAVVNGVLYAVGGYNGSNYLTAVEAYDPATNTWSTKAPLPGPQYAMAGGVVNGVLYAAGGYTTGQLATVVGYDPATDTWSTQPSMPTARSGIAGGVVNGVLHVIGGQSTSGYLATVEALQPCINSVYHACATGTLGIGSPTPGSDRQEFNVDVDGNLTGILFYRDWTVVRQDGTVGTLTVDPGDPQTAITAYSDWAGACADATRGVTIEGTGRLDTGSLTSFSVATCDNGAAESGADLFRMDVPPHNYSLARFLSSGDVAKSGTATIIFQDGFESGTLSGNGWEGQSDAPLEWRYSISPDPARAKTGTRSLECLFTPSNGYGKITRWWMPGYDEVFLRFHVLFENGFENMRWDGFGMHFSALAGNRIDDAQSSWGHAGETPTGTDYFYAGIDPQQSVGDSTLRPFSFYTYWPDMATLYGTYTHQTSPAIDLVAGEWQEVIHHVKLNTPGQSNGSQALWINGVKKIEMLNMRWRTTTDLRLNELLFENYMPGGRKTQYLWIDDVVVWRP